MSRSESGRAVKSEHLNLVRDSLSEAQVTVRAYDTKAQIVGVGYAFALGIVGGTSDWFPKASQGDVVPILVFWATIMAPLFLFGYVLYPTRKSVTEVKHSAAIKLERILYVDPAVHNSVDELKSAACRCDPFNELAYELLKVSNLRELKRKRFIRGLVTAALAFLTLFAVQMSGTFR